MNFNQHLIGHLSDGRVPVDRDQVGFHAEHNTRRAWDVTIHYHARSGALLSFVRHHPIPLLPRKNVSFVPAKLESNFHQYLFKIFVQICLNFSLKQEKTKSGLKFRPGHWSGSLYNSWRSRVWQSRKTDNLKWQLLKKLRSLGAISAGYYVWNKDTRGHASIEIENAWWSMRQVGVLTSPYPWVASIIRASFPHECHGYDLVDLPSKATATILKPMERLSGNFIGLVYPFSQPLFHSSERKLTAWEDTSKYLITVPMNSSIVQRQALITRQ